VDKTGKITKIIGYVYAESWGRRLTFGAFHELFRSLFPKFLMVFRIKCIIALRYKPTYPRVFKYIFYIFKVLVCLCNVNQVNTCPLFIVSIVMKTTDS
jgi:hypothetical protein